MNRPDRQAQQNALAKRIENLPPDKRELLTLMLQEEKNGNPAPLSPALVPLQPHGTKAPLYFVPPIMGTIFPYFPLAQLLEKTRPVYGIQPYGLSGEGKPHNRIEDMAAYAIEAIRTRQPGGPYLLGGYSFGGLIAFEMARQLHTAGQRVQFLALLEAWTPIRTVGYSVLDAWVLWFSIAFDIWPHIYDFMALTRAARSSAGTRHTDGAPALRPILRVFYANMQAYQRYTSKSYPDRITLFRTGKPSAKRHRDPSRGWRQLTESDVDVQWVSGNHISVMQGPHLRNLAEKLRTCLAALRD